MARTDSFDFFVRSSLPKLVRSGAMLAHPVFTKKVGCVGCFDTKVRSG